MTDRCACGDYAMCNSPECVDCMLMRTATVVIDGHYAFGGIEYLPFAEGAEDTDYPHAEEAS